jgi:hypothetical protein
VRHDVVHKRQAGVAERQKLADRDLEELREDLPQFRQTCQPAVVAASGQSRLADSGMRPRRSDLGPTDELAAD